MHVATVNGKYLANGLRKTTTVKYTNALVASLEFTKVETRPNGLALTATNLDTFVMTGIAANFSIPGHTFYLSPNAVEVLLQLHDVDEIKISVDTKELTFQFGEDYMKFANEPIDSFPDTPLFDPTIDFAPENIASDLNAIFNLAVKYSHNDDTKPAMCGVLFTNNHIVATNANYLLQITHDIHDKPFAAILNKSFIKALSSLAGDKKVKIKLDDTFISINDNATKIVSRLVNASYPNYQTVIPKEQPLHIRLNKAELLKNMNLVRLLANNSTQKVVFNFKPQSYTLATQETTLMQEIRKQGSCDIIKDLDGKVSPDDEFRIAFNSKYLLNVFSSLDEETIVFEMNKDTTCLTIHEGAYMFLIMPLHLQDAK